MSAEIHDLLDRVKRKIGYIYRTHADVDDLIQEAVLDAWKMHMDGKSDAYILFWVPKRITRFMGDKPDPFTGSAGEHGGSRVATTTAIGDACREKIKQAQREYFGIHGKMPSNAEIGRMIDMAPRRVSKYVNRANFNMPKAPDEPPTLSYIDGWSEEFSNGDSSYNRAIAVDGFEETTVDSMLIGDMLPELKDREREVIYLHYWRDMPKAEVARTMNAHPATIHETHNNALNRLRDLLGVET